MALIYCSNCGARISDKAETCPKCGYIRSQSIEEPEKQPTSFESSSSKEIPLTLGKWNWGAFTFYPLWCAFNGVYWPLSILAAPILTIIASTASYGLAIFLYIISVIASLVFACIMGSKGNECAWEKSKYKNAQQFDHVQRNWNRAGVIMWCFILYNIIVFLFILSMAAYQVESLIHEFMH